MISINSNVQIILVLHTYLPTSIYTFTGQAAQLHRNLTKFAEHMDRGYECDVLAIYTFDLAQN